MDRPVWSGLNDCHSALANLVITRATLMPSDLGIQQLEEKNLTCNQRKAMETASVTELLAILPAKQKRSVEIASKKGASSWLNALPIAGHGFALHKSAFGDAICLCYGWQPPLLPSHCICGSIHILWSMNCPSGGFPSIRHNEVRDLTSAFLSEIMYIQNLLCSHYRVSTLSISLPMERQELDLMLCTEFLGKRPPTLMSEYSTNLLNPMPIPPYQNAIENMNWIRRENMKKE